MKVKDWDSTSDDVLRDYEVLRNELNLYNPELLKRPLLIVLTKIDLPNTDEHIGNEQFGGLGLPISKISALTGEGLDELKNRLWVLIEDVHR
jgi:GTP-binding protein